jgi:hypothetical protein
MQEVTELTAIAYYDKKEGWFFEGFNKPIKGVIFWCWLPELPEDPRFKGLTANHFGQKFSINTVGSVGTKVVLRKSRRDATTPTAPTMESFVNLERKFCKTPEREHETFMEKITAIKKSQVKRKRGRD